MNSIKQEAAVSIPSHFNKPSRSQIEKFELPSLLRARQKGLLLSVCFASIWFLIMLIRFFGLADSDYYPTIKFIAHSDVILFIVILMFVISGTLYFITLIIPHHLAKREVENSAPMFDEPQTEFVEVQESRNKSLSINEPEPSLKKEKSREW